MSGFDAGIVNEIRVWTMEPKPIGETGNYTFPWNWGDWIEHKRLIANSSTLQPGAMGHADFTLLREVLSDNQKNMNGRLQSWSSTDFPVVPGQYIMITAGPLATVWPAGRINPLYVLWWGFIDQIDGEQLAGTTEIIGSVKALGVGHLLDRMTARGWKRSDSSGNPAPVNNPDSANLGGPLDGNVIGNCVLGQGFFLFQNDPVFCDSTAPRLWTKWRLLDHFRKYGLTDEKIVAGVRWNLLCYDGSTGTDPTGTTIAGYLNSTAIPEVFSLRNQSCKGIIDILIPRAQGVGWSIAFNDLGDEGVGWTILIYSLTDGTYYGLPSYNSYKQDVDLSELPTVKFEQSKSAVDVPDEIVVEGNQIIFGVTAGYIDGNVQNGWDQTTITGQEQLYRDGAKNGTGYSALTRAEQLDRNRSLRQGPALVDVFTRYNLKPFFGGSGTTNGDLLRAPTIPGQDSASKPMCPEVLWTSPNLTFNESVSRCPYLPTASLARTLPWIEGFSRLGVDQRPFNMRAFPSFAKPRMFYYDEAKADGKKWVDLTARGGSRATPSLDVDDRGISLRVQYDMSERLGYNTVNLTTDGVYDLGEVVTTPVEGIDIFDWKKCAFTFGIPSDQRVQFVIRRPGLDDSTQVRYSMKITDEKLNCWIMHGGSILSVDQDGQPSRIEGTGPSKSVIVRNDFALAESRAKQLATFYFRSRKGFTYTGMRPDSPPTFAYIGAAVGTITETTADEAAGISAVSSVHETVVELITHTYGMAPRITITADLPQAPNFGGSANPAGGGAISLSLGGTVSQATQATKQDVAKLQADGQRAPLVVPFTPNQNPRPNLFVIQGGQTFTAFGIFGITKILTALDATTLPPGTGGSSGDTVTVAPWPIPASLPDGIGVGRLYGTTTYQFILLDSSAPCGNDLIQTQPCFTEGTQSFTKVSGGVNYVYNCAVAFCAF